MTPDFIQVELRLSYTTFSLYGALLLLSLYYFCSTVWRLQKSGFHMLMFVLVLCTCLLVMTTEFIKVYAEKKQQRIKQWVLAYAICNCFFYLTSYFSHAIYVNKYLALALRLRAIQGHTLQTATIQTIYLGLALTYLLLTVGITVVLIVYYYFLIMRDANIFDSTAVNWTV